MFKFKEFLCENRNVLELVTGYACNNNCVYCNVSLKRKLGNRYVSESKRILQEYRKERELLVITGGEPTLMFNDLLEIIKFARSPSINYESILLETNARIFSQPVNVSRIREVSEFRRTNVPSSASSMLFEVAICGASLRLHDSITRVPGSFKQTILGIRNLASVFGANSIFVKVVINALNYKDVINITSFIFKELGIPNIEFVFSFQAGQYAEKRTLADYRELKPFIKKLLGLRLKDNQKLYLDNIPLCLLENREEMLSSHYYSQGHGHFFKRIDLDKATAKFDNKAMCKHRNQCYYGLICDGIDRTYLKHYGYRDIIKIPVDLTKKYPIVVEEKEIDNIKADVISHLSGGVDSKTMSALFAKQHPDLKMVLITYDAGNEKSNELSRISAKEIMAKHSNIVGHYILTIPRNLASNVLLSGLKKELNDGTLRPCPLCSYLWLSASIYLHKKIFKGKIIIEGMRIERELRKYYMDERILFTRKYGIKIMHPFLELSDKKDVLKLAKNNGLSESGSQGVCFFKNSKLA